MKTTRLKVELEPGLRFLLKQEATGKANPGKISYSEAAGQVLHRVLRDGGGSRWNPTPILTRWAHPSPKARPPGAALVEIVTGLHDQCAILNAPVRGKHPALDELVNEMRRAVQDQLLPAAQAELAHYRSALLAGTPLTTADHDRCLTARLRLKAALNVAQVPPADTIQDCRNFLRLTGAAGTPLGEGLRFSTPPPEGAPDEFVHVPLKPADEGRLRTWHKQTGLDLKRLAAALLAAGASGGCPPQAALDALLEYRIFNEVLESCRKLINVIKDYDSRLNGQPCPYADEGLNPFLHGVRQQMRELRHQAAGLQRVLTAAMAARWQPRFNQLVGLRRRAGEIDLKCACAGNRPDASTLGSLFTFLSKLEGS